jgi:hypothetical protein
MAVDATLRADKAAEAEIFDDAALVRLASACLTLL